MNYNLSSVSLEKISVVQTSAVKSRKKKILSQMIRETINMGDYFQYVQLSSVQFSCSVMSDSLRPHGLLHARPPCPSPTP